MCENDTMEIKLVADTGTVFIGFKKGKVWLGLSKKSDPEAAPTTKVVLTDRQLKVAVSELSILLDEMKEEQAHEEDDDDEEDDEEDDDDDDDADPVP